MFVKPEVTPSTHKDYHCMLTSPTRWHVAFHTTHSFAHIVIQLFMFLMPPTLHFKTLWTKSDRCHRAWDYRRYQTPNQGGIWKGIVKNMTTPCLGGMGLFALMWTQKAPSKSSKFGHLVSSIESVKVTAWLSQRHLQKNRNLWPHLWGPNLFKWVF